MTKKYEMTEKTLEYYGVTLHRIRALKDFSDVKAGDLGGWIKKEDNLSHDGNARVSGNARVYGGARVSGNARVYGGAQVSGGAWVSGNTSYSPIFVSGLRWNVTITDNEMTIGCESHSLAEWESFSNRRILEMDGKSSARFWNEYKGFLLGIAKASGRSW